MTSIDDMACNELVELITDYLEDALSANERARFERHLGECDGCSAYLDQMRATIRATGMLTAEQVPVEGREELLRAFRGWARGDRPAGS